MITPWEKVFRRKYEGTLHGFSEPVMIRLPFARTIPKLEPRWHPGLWLGKLEQADTHIVGVQSGVIIGRSVRAVLQDEVVGDLFTNMSWTPWNLRSADVSTGVSKGLATSRSGLKRPAEPVCVPPSKRLALKSHPETFGGESSCPAAAAAASSSSSGPVAMDTSTAKQGEKRRLAVPSEMDHEEDEELDEVCSHRRR